MIRDHWEFVRVTIGATMQDFPHHYAVMAAGTPDGDVQLNAVALPSLRSAPPLEFDGPGTRWSPETLLVGVVGDCLILTFRAMARASKLAWISLECQVCGTLDRSAQTTLFTGFDIHALLTVSSTSDAERARRLMEKAERGCLITNSLKAHVRLTVDVEAVDQGAAVVRENRTEHSAEPGPSRLGSLMPTESRQDSH